MDTVARALAVYLFLLVVFRISGKRTLAQITTFDFVLLLILAETTQQALIGEDFSIVNAWLLIATLIAVDIALSLLQRRFGWLDRMVEGEPVVLVRNGEPLLEPMRRSRVGVRDVLEAARQEHGIRNLSQIEHAVLERGGGISVVPRDRQ